MTITGLQVRAARAFLVWDRRDLVRQAVVALATIERIETAGAVSGKGMTAALASVQATLEAEGIEFIEENGVLGVRLHAKPAGAKECAESAKVARDPKSSFSTKRW